MSTRSNVIVRVKPEDIGKTFKFSKKKLPLPVKDWGEEKVREHSQKVTIEKPYIGIYCHWDGYPSGVGKALMEHFSDYDTLLNLIVGGFCSVISDDYVLHYANRKGEDWKHIKPHQSDKPEVCAGWTEYAYVYEDDQWCVGEVEWHDNEIYKIDKLIELTEEMVND